MRIGYAKIGRSLKMNPDTHGFQGDAEAPNLLRRLALRNPDVTWVIVGRNDGGTMGLPNVENPWDAEYSGGTYHNLSADKVAPAGWESFEYQKGEGSGWAVNPEGLARDKRIAALIGQLDGAIIHLGQHGCSHIPIPPASTTWAQIRAGKDHLTQPQLWSRNFGTFIDEGLNALGDRTDGKAPIVWLCADPRNYLKTRSIKWPTGLDEVLAQYSFKRKSKHERFEDPRSPASLGYRFCSTERGGEVWVASNRYVHADLELMILPDDWEALGQVPFYERKGIGIATTSFAVGKETRRSQLVRDWMLKAFPEAEVWGKWDPSSLEDVPPDTVKLNDPADFFNLLGSWRVTLALPTMEPGWTAAKPYQCFASNVACFMAGSLDDHGWVLPTRRWSDNTQPVAPGLYSARNDWTPEELELAALLRVKESSEFVERARALIASSERWEWVVKTQRALLARRWEARGLEKKIESRLGLSI